MPVLIGALRTVECTRRIVLPVGEAVRRKAIDPHAQRRVEGQVMCQSLPVLVGKERGLYRMFLPVLSGTELLSDPVQRGVLVDGMAPGGRVLAVVTGRPGYVTHHVRFHVSASRGIRAYGQVPERFPVKPVIGLQVYQVLSAGGETMQDVQVRIPEAVVVLDFTPHLVLTQSGKSGGLYPRSHSDDVGLSGTGVHVQGVPGLGGSTAGIQGQDQER